MLDSKDICATVRVLRRERQPNMDSIVEDILTLTEPVRRRVAEMKQDVLYGDETTYSDITDFLRAIAAEIEQQAEAVESLKGHQHKFNDEDYCIYCGLDGRS
jgi:hypothetical protein